MVETAYRYLRRELLAGVYPAGTKRRYGPIGADIKFSAIPIREAANRLASEGFREIIPNLGAFVRIPDRCEFGKLYVVWASLESAAVRLACQRMKASQIEECDTYVDRMREVAHAFRDSGAASMPTELREPFKEADVAFHMLIVDAAGNRFMVKSLGDLSVITRIFLSRARESFTLSIVARAYLHHRQILRAIVRRDTESAVALMQRHINVGCEITMRNFDRIEREERLDRTSFRALSDNGAVRPTNGKPVEVTSPNRSAAEVGP